MTKGRIQVFTANLRFANLAKSGSSRNSYIGSIQLDLCKSSQHWKQQTPHFGNLLMINYSIIPILCFFNARFIFHHSDWLPVLLFILFTWACLENLYPRSLARHSGFVSFKDSTRTHPLWGVFLSGNCMANLKNLSWRWTMILVSTGTRYSWIFFRIFCATNQGLQGLEKPGVGC